MAASPAVHSSPYSWFDRLAALAIIVGAAFSCYLCLANDNPAACLGVLLVFGMALFAVAASRADVRANMPAPRYRAPETAARPARRIALTWGQARLWC